ncbi:hypothetical protein K402DRAFT_360022 [Aulographum hederae CBS 113979]|uniref:Bromodomain-containing protein n=1 Tax=Aulographum hederae CBS 113979 TaxID=1176131 RepID=A0A6G1GTM5_9PEZI|nr:hypothetical protein K402DRAFT_360022 [Aulographum hederae CBS 113979]
MAPTRNKSPTPVPTTEKTQEDESTVTDAQWEAMQTVLSGVYAYRTEDNYDPTKVFQRMVNKRSLPDYFAIIKEPMAMSVIKTNLQSKKYKSFAAFVRDFALIPYNAQVYNRPDSGVYQDALEVNKALEEQLKKLAEKKVISEEDAALPFLGEIPSQDDVEDLVAEDAEEDDEDDEDEDDEEELDDSDDDGAKRKRKRGPRSTAAISKRDSGGKKDADDKKEDPESRKKRGRPPRVDTPMEARVKNIMKGMRKPRNSENQLMIGHFERIPDKAVMPEYFAEIKNPMAMDLIKKKLKRKKYASVEQFMKDVELIFENAKNYNEDDSQIYKDAVHLQKESRVLAELEMKKPDTDYVMEDGRIPMPSGILHNGELWKVGDWVHIQNANDPTKPIVAQVYRTWQDVDGGKWVNVCWYYHPEQTVHRFDRHFFEKEVVKTGQYRDHPIDEVVDRCFVMFFTRYNKGRPRNFPADKEIYVCEARYNEEKHKLNKIKTWASCLPDEVRDKDYEMDLFDQPKKIKKVPSPIAYLLKDDAKETDDVPKPEWGADNAPPKIGAVHKRPRDPKDSPPPEPTPTPPPQPPPPPPRQISHTPIQNNGYTPETSHQRPDYSTMNSSASYHNGQAPFPPAPAQTPPIQPSYHHPSQNPFTGSHPSSYTSHHHHSASPAPLQPMPTPHQNSFPPLTPHNGYSSYTAPQEQHSHRPQPNQYTANQYNTNQQYAQQQARTAAMPTTSGYRPPTVEVYTLDEHTNSRIPAELREKYKVDDKGRIMLFTTPPLHPSETTTKYPKGLSHTARYKILKMKRDILKKMTPEERMKFDPEMAKKFAAAEAANAANGTAQSMHELENLRAAAIAKQSSEPLRLPRPYKNIDQLIADMEADIAGTSTRRRITDQEAMQAIADKDPVTGQEFLEQFWIEHIKGTMAVLEPLGIPFKDQYEKTLKDQAEHQAQKRKIDALDQEAEERMAKLDAEHARKLVKMGWN